MIDRHRDMASRPIGADAALGVLETLSAAARISFDRLLAARVLGEAERTIPGEDCNAWSGRLVEAGESLNLRVRALECRFDDVLAFLRQGTPVAACLPGAGDKAIGWRVLTKVRGRKICVKDPTGVQSEQWVSIRALRRELGLTGRNSEGRWVVAQAALACDPASSSAEGDSPGKKPKRPLLRLICLLYTSPSPRDHG